LALADTANLIVTLRLDDKLSAPLGRIDASLSRFQSGALQTGKGIGQIGLGLARAGAIAAGTFATGIGTAAKLAGDFEAQLNTINTIVKLNGSQLTTLGEGIRKTFRETGAPLEELTSAYYDLLSAGVKVEDAQSVLNTAVKLGIGGIATTKESVDLLTTAINAYGLNASQAAGAADIFAAAVRDGKVTVAELSGSFADVAPLASQVGIKLEEIGAGYATLTARGVEATEVGTQFNRAIIELLKPGPELTQVMKGLGLETFETSIKQKGLVQTLEDVRVEAEKQGIPFQDLFGRLEAYKFALATTGPNQAKFNQELAAMGKAAGETNAQFEERQKGLNFQLAKLKAAAQDAGITIGQALIPKLVPLIEKLSTFINQNQGKIAEFGQKLADSFGAFADKIQTTDFTGIIDGLKLLGEVGKKVVDIFLSLPPGVQSALVAGLAINKLSGGLVAQGVGNVAGGFLKIAFSRGATPLTPLYVQQVGGIPGAGGVPVAGGGGIISKLLGITTAVGLGAILGSAVGHALVDSGIAAGAKYEGTKFDQFVAQHSSDPVAIQRAINSISANIGKFYNENDPIQSALAHALFGDQLKVLEDQRTILENLLKETKDGKQASPLTALIRDFKEKLKAPLKLDDDALITALAQTSEFGKAGVGTTIESGPLTGTDPYGEQALALFRQAQFPQQGRTLGEIQRHIIAAEEVQAEYLQSGDINSAKRTQAVIDGLHALLGTTDKTIPILSQTKEETQRQLAAVKELKLPLGLGNVIAQQIRDRSDESLARQRNIEGYVGRWGGKLDNIAAKDFSPTFSPTIVNNNTVNASLSVAQALQTITISNSIRYDGKLVPI